MTGRMMRGPDLVAVRRERRVGNWGRASEHIGAHWEEVGLARLRVLLDNRRPWPTPGYRVVGWVALAADPEMQSTLGRVGLPSPDIVVGLGNADGSHALQAVDMKWHLEFASYRQISGDTLADLMAKGVPSLQQQVEERIGPTDQVGEYLDGLLFAPSIPANRAFLASRENRRLEYPIETADVIFEAVDGREFFSPLPGWEMGLLLAGFDRALGTLRTAEGAERYYRLGAGLQGAAAQLLSSIFVEEPPPVGPDRAFAWLRATFRGASAGFLAQEVDKRMAQRSQMLKRLRELMRSPYRLSDLARTLHKRGLTMPESIEEDSPYAAKCRDLLKQVVVEHRQSVRQYGHELVQKGMSDAEALAAIAPESGRFQALARAHADRIAAGIFGAR